MSFKEWMTALRRAKVKTNKERKEEELIRLTIQALDMRFKNLEKRVSKLEKGKAWTPVDGGEILQ